MVVDELTGRDGQRTEIRDATPHGAADGGAGRKLRGVADGLVIRENVVGEGQEAAVQDAAAGGGKVVGILVGPPVGDRQVRDGHRGAGADVEDPAVIVAADRHQAGPRADDRHVLAIGGKAEDSVIVCPPSSVESMVMVFDVSELPFTWVMAYRSEPKLPSSLLLVTDQALSRARPSSASSLGLAGRR